MRQRRVLRLRYRYRCLECRWWWWRWVYFPVEIEAEGREEGTEVEECIATERGNPITSDIGPTSCPRACPRSCDPEGFITIGW